MLSVIFGTERKRLIHDFAPSADLALKSWVGHVFEGKRPDRNN